MKGQSLIDWPFLREACATVSSSKPSLEKRGYAEDETLLSSMAAVAVLPIAFRRLPQTRAFVR